MTNSTTTVEKDDVSTDEIDIEPVVGIHEYTGRLYSPQKAADVMNINVLTDEPTHDIPTATEIEQWIESVNEESRQKAKTTGWHTHTPYVALVAGSGEQLYESRSLCSYAAFFHRDITGGIDRHKAYCTAYKSDEFDVAYTADYEHGTVTITVKRTSDESQEIEVA